MLVLLQPRVTNFSFTSENNPINPSLIPTPRLVASVGRSFRSSTSPCRIWNLCANRKDAKQRTRYYAAPVRNPLYNESSWCAPPSSGEKKEKKRHGREERTEERKRRDVGRARPLLRGGPLLFSGVFRSRSSSSAEKEGRGGGDEGKPPKKGESTSRARVSARTSATEKDPLLRPHYIVYLSSEPPPFLALRLLPPSSLPAFSAKLLACPSPACV